MKKIFSVSFVSVVVLLLLTSYAFSSQAIIQRAGGQCEVFAKADWVKASAGMPLYQSSKIRTKTKMSYCDVLFEDGHSIRVGGNTAVTLSDLTSEKIQISLEKGNVRSKVKKLLKAKFYGVKTPTAVAAVRGTDFNVAYENQVTKVEVFEGVVSAREEKTGGEVQVQAGEFTTVESGKEPAKPQTMPEKSESTAPGEQSKNEIKSEAQREIFLEISREAVMERASEEIKMAEYQNGKAMVDAFGVRVRLEEYIVRPKDNTKQFKYVVLNTRENRFDFGKILFTFDKDLPSDLSVATKDMFYKVGDTAPEYKLTSMDSVLSNTYDKLLEEATGGSYTEGTVSDPLNVNYGKKSWSHYWGDYKLYAGNLTSTENDGRGKLVYTTTNPGDVTTPTPTTQTPDSTLWSKVSENTPESSRELFGSIWIQQDSYFIDDNGKKVKIDKTTDLYKTNFELVYNSSEFKDKIDLVFSSKLL
ncbi:MAG: FecR family protein, partial [Elusimicrobiota bacterium]